MLSASDFREDRYDLPLHVAADSGNIVEIKKLLASCNNPNQVDYQYRTPLHYAALKGNIQAMSLLLNAGAIADVQDFNEMYPLNLAIAKNGFEGCTKSFQIMAKQIEAIIFCIMEQMARK